MTTIGEYKLFAYRATFNSINQNKHYVKGIQQTTFPGTGISYCLFIVSILVSFIRGSVVSVVRMSPGNLLRQGTC